MKTARNNNQAFTLIELLPVFAQAREKARQTSCLFNTKQLGTALMMYLQDYDETFYPHVTERTQIFKCPSAPAWPAPKAGAWFTTDYGNNHNEANLPAAKNQSWYLNNSDFGFNETTTLASRGGLYPQPWVFDDSEAPDALQQARFKARHSGGGNIAFADGHAKWLRPEQTWKSYPNNFWRRNPSQP